MTTAQQIGLVLVLAELALMVAVLTPVLLKYRAVNREWADLTEQVDAARADFDKREVTVTVEPLSVEHGVWCEACLLSSAMTVHFASTIGDKTTLGSRTACGEHS